MNFTITLSFSIIILAAILYFLASSVRIVSQSDKYVIERLGKFHTIWNAGFHIKVPIIDQIVNKVSMREQVLTFPPHPVITKDNVTIDIDVVIFYQVMDVKLFTYGAENPILAVENLISTTLRNIIGNMELDGTLSSRNEINLRIRSELDKATEAWGIKVNRVEVKNIEPPEDILSSMQKQMKAEREKRSQIHLAEGAKESSILRAEGLKQSKILEAEAMKQAKILEAEAMKQSQIKEAEGQAKSIRIVQEATAEGIRMINKAKASKEYLTLKSFETLKDVANGHSTKIIIPSEIQNLAGLFTSLKETVTTDHLERDEEKVIKEESNALEDEKKML